MDYAKRLNKSRKFRSHSCSDKILLWNMVGMQGTRLAGMVGGRVFMKGLIVGRKYGGVWVRRAVCCRGEVGGRKRGKGGGRGEEGKVEINHPKVMGTGVRMDEGWVGEGGAEFGGGVWVWWRGEGGTGGGIKEEIDGITGRRKKDGGRPRVMWWGEGEGKRVDELKRKVMGRGIMKEWNWKRREELSGEGGGEE
ncbi:hypothetical protein TrCOL_g13267 [Triparma columacea]|uniref:A to I editase domain-containing protein n=1 Tax=Triparma columacea TaxID=722753 RepID=A0A9W7L1E2_9STRA|nr:hypothetical protein TrCOL_g13267 [Triparma columacea]